MRSRQCSERPVPWRWTQCLKHHKGIYIFHLVPNTILTLAAGLDSSPAEGYVILGQAINGISGPEHRHSRGLQCPFLKAPLCIFVMAKEEGGVGQCREGGISASLDAKATGGFFLERSIVLLKL